jgi:hypothetical protein
MRAFVFVLLLAGCGAVVTEEARDPFSSHSLIGMDIGDLVGCAGTDFTFLQTDTHEGVVEYTTTNTDKGFDLDVEGVSLSFGGAGSCKMALTVLDTGEVARVAFPQSHVAGIAPPYSACSPLLSECLRDPANTTRKRPYNAFKWLLSKKPQTDIKALVSP